MTTIRHIALLIAGLIMIPAVGLADPGQDPFQTVGSIAVGNPLTRAERGFTESTNPCGAAHPKLGNTNGVDGVWIRLPEGAAGRSAVLVTDGADADVWFYSDQPRCRLVEGPDAPGWNSMSEPLTGQEAGVVPPGATWAIVDLVVGRNATFSFSLP